MCFASVKQAPQSRLTLDDHITEVHMLRIFRDTQVSTVIGAAVKSQREDTGWSEGVAIWVAVMIVSFVGRGLPQLKLPPHTSKP